MPDIQNFFHKALAVIFAKVQFLYFRRKLLASSIKWYLFFNVCGSYAFSHNGWLYITSRPIFLGRCGSLFTHCSFYKKYTQIQNSFPLRNPALPIPLTPVSSELVSNFLLQMMWSHVLFPVQRVHHLHQAHVQQPAHQLNAVTLGKSVGRRRSLKPLEVSS